MRRREFFTVIGAATTWPFVASAQQAIPVIGFLNVASAEGYAVYVAAFRDGLKESGYVDVQNVAIEYRWADGNYDRLPDMAADLLRRQVSVIVANTPANLVALRAVTDAEIADAFAGFAQLKAGVLVIGADAVFNSKSQLLAELSLRYAVPAIYQYTEFANAGGLISYGGSIKESYRWAGVYAGRILKGVKPADLPVQQSTKIELIVNLKTAKALGVTVPLSLLGRADRVIK
jgi:ABC-type uncharacterized transport system substrate-binding protein